VELIRVSCAKDMKELNAGTVLQRSAENAEMGLNLDTCVFQPEKQIIQESADLEAFSAIAITGFHANINPDLFLAKTMMTLEGVSLQEPQ